MLPSEGISDIFSASCLLDSLTFAFHLHLQIFAYKDLKTTNYKLPRGADKTKLEVDKHFKPYKTAFILKPHNKVFQKALKLLQTLYLITFGSGGELLLTEILPTPLWSNNTACKLFEFICFVLRLYRVFVVLLDISDG